LKVSDNEISLFMSVYYDSVHFCHVPFVQRVWLLADFRLYGCDTSCGLLCNSVCEEVIMAYRNLTQEQFSAVRELAIYLCKTNGQKTIGEYKKVGNEIIDEIEAGTKKFATDCTNRIVIVEALKGKTNG